MTDEHPPDSIENLARQLAVRGVMPFDTAIVQSPWHPVLDCPALYENVKTRLLDLVNGCVNPGNQSRCATVLAPPGYGKTHLLAWLRQQLDSKNKGIFVYVPPVLPTGLALSQHLVRATVDSLFHHSDRQRLAILQAARAELIDQFDSAVVSKSMNLADLGLSLNFLGLFTRRAYYIRHRVPEEQEQALQSALAKSKFLRYAFTRFDKRHPPTSNGTRPDHEGFVAACLLACGNEEQQASASRWFQSLPLSAEEQQATHLLVPCHGDEKSRNVLRTLQLLSGQHFCLAFDQLEDSFRSFTLANRWPELLTQFSYVLQNLTVLPSFSEIFTFDKSIFEGDFRKAMPPFLIDRMTADGGELRLPPLRDSTARELVRCRMDELVWKKLGGLKPPEDRPYFPLTESDVTDLRKESDGELRDFLFRARQLYLARLYPTPQVREIVPSEGQTNTPTRILIRGVHLPHQVRILFGERAAVSVDCTPDQGEIRATTPTILEEGTVTVIVRDFATDEPIAGELTFAFKRSDPIPRPLHQHVDRALLKRLRNDKNLTQAVVGNAVGIPQRIVSEFERFVCDLDDSTIEKIANLYGVSLQDILMRSQP